MAAKILLLILVAITITVGAEAAPAPGEWSVALNDTINALYPKLEKAFKGVAAAAPPGKMSEIENATLTQMLMVTVNIAKANAKGDEKKAIELATSYEIAAGLVIEASPAEKFEVMEDSFNAVSAPNPLLCPAVDKAYCETYSKIQNALNGVAAAALLSNKLETKDAILKKGFSPAIKAINKAYAKGDEKVIAGVLAAYSKAADAVIAAPPAEKFKAMEGTFAAAAATVSPHQKA